jgi:PAS domain S-box-containing protein
MDDSRESRADELERLGTWVDELAAVLTGPAASTGDDPTAMVDAWAETLLRALALDFVYVRLEGPTPDAPFEVTKQAGSDSKAPSPESLAAVARRWLERPPETRPRTIPDAAGDGHLSLSASRLGLHDDLGTLVVGARRAAFPRRTDSLLLTVAANQAALALLESRHRGERKRLADDLASARASDGTLREIINTLPATAWSTLPDGSCDFLSERWLGYAGMSAEQAQGWGWTAAIHPDDLPGLNEHWKGCLLSGAPVDAEARMRRSDGVYRWFLFRANPLRDQSGTIVKWYGTNIDIDDRKRAQEELRQSELEARLIVDCIPGQVAVLGPAGDVRHVNRRMAEFFGVGARELSRWRTSDIVPERERPRVVAAMAKSLETGTPFELENRLRRFDGAYRWVQVRGLPLMDEDGRAARWYFLVVDIHEKREAEEALDRTRSELARVTRSMSLGALTASIAHEVNQPLSGIITNASTCLRLLAASPPNVEGALETARRTIRDGNRAAEVIARLRAMFGRKALAAEEVDLNGAVRDVLSLLSSHLERNRVVLRTELAGQPLLVNGDRIQLQQVIVNLIRNACDAMGDVEDRPRELLIETGYDEDDRARLTVHDVGIGLDATAAERLFEAFYSTKGDGMGIGLSVSRYIIERHRGRLWAAPNEGPGATFAFSLPRRSG